MGALPDSSIGEGSSDITRLVHELESRLSKLETRLEESIDSRERLERQVAAQTEELRVQRAAIARTQRAVRNMGQQAVDDSATEPALKQPE
jgi:septal ring factor EnvC (AmiA/AmiB activator)